MATKVEEPTLEEESKAGGEGESADQEDDSNKLWSLAPEEELRIQASKKSGPVKVKLLKGAAEIFGCELAVGREYEFTAAQFAVFTWDGCEIQVEGKPDFAYTAGETPMLQYLNLHGALERMREAAWKSGDPGPTVMIVGPTDSGKSSLCRTLLNYAVRARRQPLYVDLDVGQNGISIPGAVAATPVDTMISAEGKPRVSPLAWFYGHSSPGAVMDHMKTAVESLAKAVKARQDKHAPDRVSGAVINTCGWIDGGGYTLILHAAQHFQPSVIVVLNSELLFANLKKEQSLRRCRLIHLPKSGGVVLRSPELRAEARQRRIRDYFYGVNREFHPHRKTVGFHDMLIYRVGGVAVAPSSALPIGASRRLDPNQLTRVIPNPSLVNSILGISMAKDPNEVLSTSVAGYVSVVEVDEEKQTVTLLVPNLKPFPSNFFLLGSIKWYDQE